MKINLVCFSQTGNTKKIAIAMSDSFIQAGHDARTIDINEATDADLSSCDVLGIGTPTFESHAPTSVKHFLKSIKVDLTGKKIFLFATGGGASGNVLSDMARILKKKQATLLKGFFSLGEMHHPAPCILGKSPNRPNEADLANAKKFALSMLDCVSSDSKESMPKSLRQRYGFYNLVGLIGTFDSVIRLLVPKPKHDNTKCSKCGLCSKKCPMQDIAMNPYPQLNSKCIRCYHCQNICPNQAFTSSWVFGNLVVLSLWNTVLMKTFGEYEG